VRSLQKSGLALCLLFSLPAAVSAQKPSLAPADLAYTEQIIGKFHVIAQVGLDDDPNKPTHYQWDYYPADTSSPEIYRIKMDSGTFAKKGDNAWLQSDDWGETGKAVPDDLTQELGVFVSIVSIPFAKPSNHDSSQGANVWKFIDQTSDKTGTYYTYEESRERPNPDGVYPRYTFRKLTGDVDGKLFLCKVTGQLRNGNSEIPFTISYDFLIPLPAGTVIKVVPPATH
jgi:hypothetical protein